MLAMTEWTQDDIDDEMFRDPEPCDCQFTDIDILEGRGHCPECGRTWYLTADELRAERYGMLEMKITIQEDGGVMNDLIRALTDIVDRYREVERRERREDYDKGYLAGLGDAAEIAARALGIEVTVPTGG